VDLNFLFVSALNGVIYGAFLLLTTLGLSVVFGLGRVVNFAHGALYALGGYVVLDLARHRGLSFWLAAPAAAALVIPVGVVVDRLTIAPIRRRADIYTLLVTFGVSFVLVGAIETTWGRGTMLIPPPPGLGGTVSVLGNPYPLYRLVAAAVSLAVSAGVFAVIHLTPVGLRIRATTDDSEMADAIGIDTGWLLTAMFGAAAGLAALAGALGAPVFAVHPEMGMAILLDSFLAVILGGLGNLPGSALGALVVALTKSIGGGYLADWSIALLFTVVALVLIARPTGILGRGRVA
jgi:branched-chain amino acid transport system permease protein